MDGALRQVPVQLGRSGFRRPLLLIGRQTGHHVTRDEKAQDLAPRIGQRAQNRVLSP
jgi:hypothetical protein